MSTPELVETWTLTLVGLRPAWSGMGMGETVVSFQFSVLVRDRINDNAETRSVLNQRRMRPLQGILGTGQFDADCACTGEIFVKRKSQPFAVWVNTSVLSSLKNFVLSEVWRYSFT